MFDCQTIFDTLYRSALRQVSDARVIALRETGDVVLRSGLTCMVENHLARLFAKFIGRTAAADIHRDTLAAFHGQWGSIQSSSTCLCCLRRRP